jgi:hypothetical protein
MQKPFYKGTKTNCIVQFEINQCRSIAHISLVSILDSNSNNIILIEYNMKTNLPATLTPNGTIQNIPDILTLGIKSTFGHN